MKRIKNALRSLSNLGWHIMFFITSIYDEVVIDRFRKKKRRIISEDKK